MEKLKDILLIVLLCLVVATIIALRHTNKGIYKDYSNTLNKYEESLKNLKSVVDNNIKLTDSLNKVIENRDRENDSITNIISDLKFKIDNRKNTEIISTTNQKDLIDFINIRYDTTSVTAIEHSIKIDTVTTSKIHYELQERDVLYTVSELQSQSISLLEIKVSNLEGSIVNYKELLKLADEEISMRKALQEDSDEVIKTLEGSFEKLEKDNKSLKKKNTIYLIGAGILGGILIFN